MRQHHLRKLTALGLTVGSPLKKVGLRLYEAINQQGTAQLLFRGNLLGPTWPSLKHLLDLFEIDCTTVHAGAAWLLCNDDELVHRVLDEAQSNSRQCFRDDVLIPDVGFVSSGMPRKFDFRLLVMPVVILGLTLTVAGALSIRPDAPVQKVEPTASLTCALDLPEPEFQEWFRATVSGSKGKDLDVIVVQTELGSLNLKVDQALGSTILVSGSLECSDGRSKGLQFRADDSADGTLVELGTKLNP
ncbi:unannotated protein [freshwater metagenome]|uniref:Unannotated protein n=1 Tax=freshwater metagenome TaxID=449393 RepID=A0A6J6ITT7_9ZZZZ|nr:hypothetical protein [Actinomycetota bacterium]